jgi:hypothetical protein
MIDDKGGRGVYKCPKKYDIISEQSLIVGLKNHPRYEGDRRKPYYGGRALDGSGSNWL